MEPYTKKWVDKKLNIEYISISLTTMGGCEAAGHRLGYIYLQHNMKKIFLFILNFFIFFKFEYM
jgi:hypothetical protein